MTNSNGLWKLYTQSFNFLPILRHIIQVEGTIHVSNFNLQLCTYKQEYQSFRLNSHNAIIIYLSTLLVTHYLWRLRVKLSARPHSSPFLWYHRRENITFRRHLDSVHARHNTRGHVFWAAQCWTTSRGGNVWELSAIWWPVRVWYTFISFYHFFN